MAPNDRFARRLGAALGATEARGANGGEESDPNRDEGGEGSEAVMGDEADGEGEGDEEE